MKSKTLTLIGAESRRSAVLFLFIWIVILAINEFGFHAAAKSQARVADLAFEGLLRREELLVNPYLLGQAIADLEQVGLIQCTSIVSKAHPERSDFLNTQQHSLCGKNTSSWLTPVLAVHRDLTAGNNEVMNADYQVPLGPGFAMGLWGSRILWTILILMFWRALRARFKHQQEIVALETAHAETVMSVATQVSHDITAPVAALDGLLQETDYSQIPSSVRSKIHWEIVRIRDIANDLVSRFRRQGAELASRSAELIAYLIEGSVSEKRLTLRDRNQVHIEFQCGPEGYLAFASVNSAKFHRILSNLLNNAIEATPEDGGRVLVSLVCKSDTIEISVTDTGKGIPPEILSQLGKRGITSGKPSGSGLGFYDAKETWKSWGGDITISPQIGQGTCIRLHIRKAPAPDWFLEKIYLRPGQRVVVLDDDPVIHEAWRVKLKSLLNTERSIEIHYFDSGRSFLEWHHQLAGEERFSSYFFDYELKGEDETGRDIAAKIGVGAKTTIITGSFALNTIREQCERIGAKLLPKAALAGLHISIVDPHSVHPDAILIDDDIGVQIRWANSARKSGKMLHALSSAQKILDVEWIFSRSTTIYVDVELGNGVSGVNLSKQLSEFGFTELHLTTAHSSKKFNNHPMPWIRSITGKDPPWRMS